MPVCARAVLKDLSRITAFRDDCNIRRPQLLAPLPFYRIMMGLSLTAPVAMNSTSDSSSISVFLRDIGALRLMLGLLGVIVVIFAPSPDAESQRTGWGLITTGVLPAIGPMVFMVLLLDMIMSRVLMADTDAAGKRRYRRALMFDGALALVILLSWLPFILSLFA
jgi:hypothetical protein